MMAWMAGSVPSGLSTSRRAVPQFAAQSLIFKERDVQVRKTEPQRVNNYCGALWQPGGNHRGTEE